MNNASLAQLHDIVLPQAPGIWPLAIGWWLLIIVGAITLFCLIKKIVTHFQYWKIKRLALVKLQHCNNCDDINQLLKQVAMHYYDDVNIAALTGEDWIDFIDSNLPMSSKSQLTDIFDALYTPRHADFFDQYKMIAAQWLSNLSKRTFLNINAHVMNTNNNVEMSAENNVERNNANL